MASHPKHQTDSPSWQTERLVPTCVPWHKKRMIAEHMIRYQFACQFIKGKQVVDLACGSGYGCALMSKSGATSVIGVDNNADAIAYAKKNYQNPTISYVQSDVTKTTLPGKSADVVTSFETVEHLAEDRAFIKEVQRLLRPKGMFIMSTPNVEFSTGTNPYHVREYTRHQCEELLHDFSSITVYGQRKVYRPLFTAMKQFPRIAPFRPWENVKIQKLQSKQDSDYCYFIFVCS